MGIAPKKYDKSKMLKNLHDLRIEKGKTQEDVANHLHISRTTMVKIENGSRNIDPGLLFDLAQYYGTSIDFLLGLTEVRRAGETLPACDELGLSDTATMVLEYLKDRGRYGRLISEIIEHDNFEFFLNYAEQAILSITFHLGDPDSDIHDLVSRSKASGYALIPEVQKKSYNVYMASTIMESIIFDISETIFRFESDDDCD